MKKLLNIEFTKTFYNNSFRSILLIHLILFSLVIFALSQIHFSIPGFSVSKFFMFPDVWESFAYVASWFNILLTILIIILVGNEYSFNTFRQHVVTGLNRDDLLKGKLITILGISIYAAVLVFVSSVIYGIIFSRDVSFADIFSKLDVILIYFMQSIAYMVFGFLIAVIFRNTALSIVIFFAYRLIFEPVVRNLFNRAVDADIRAYFPMKVISNLTPVPELLTLASEKELVDSGGKSKLDFESMGIKPAEISTELNIVLAIIFIALFIISIRYILKKRNL